MVILYLQRQLIQFHRRICHDDIKPKTHQCDKCGDCFTSGTGLKRHKNVVHTDSRPFKCEICSKSFKMLQNLKGHKRTHTGERPYHCDQCEYTCALPSSLRTHKMRHAGEKPFKCDLCEYRCTIRPSLRKHIRKHLPPDYVTCEICGKKLKTAKILIVHKQKLHSHA